MGYDAMVVGKMDVAQGLDVLQARAQEAAFPILSANLVDKDTGELFFEPYVVLQKGDVSIGVIGISDEDVLAMGEVAEKASLLDPITTAREYVQNLREECDLIVALSRLGIEGDQELARAVPQINIIVGGKTRRFMREPVQEGDTLIVQQGYNGERIGRLSATFAGGTVVEATEEIITLSVDNYSADPDMEQLLQKYRKQYAGAADN